ncbi:AlbA family DNA-binding domain-containing protein [Streptomyces sp. TP-A0874]|uniref:AlbA family DNA-binding domain-containing protein n=1 Tax=Streptomyces sp. TP-A0874 TaxID=549819 RepID=UPI00147F896C|nr:ATP-binding protein [Streptomyces sp. TP-A0874]
MDLDSARSALHANNPLALLGLEESDWLDAKRQPYELKNAGHVEELAKDVAAFANTERGGLLVLGISTRVEDGRETLDQLVPVPRGSVNLDQLRKLIRERISPAPRGVVVERSDYGQGLAVVFIYVPPQPPGNLPHVIAAPVKKPGQVSPYTVYVPIRDADGTCLLPRTDVQRYLAAGWAALGKLKVLDHRRDRDVLLRILRAAGELKESCEMAEEASLTLALAKNPGDPELQARHPDPEIAVVIDQIPKAASERQWQDNLAIARDAHSRLARLREMVLIDGPDEVREHLNCFTTLGQGLIETVEESPPINDYDNIVLSDRFAACLNEFCDVTLTIREIRATG